MKKLKLWFFADILLVLLLLLGACSKDRDPAPVEKIRVKSSAEDGVSISYGYNSKHYLNRYDIPEMGGESAVQYDEKNRILRNAFMNFTYNESGQISKIKYDDSPSVSDVEGAFQYNDIGQLIMSQHQYTLRDRPVSRYTRTYEYDALNRLTTVNEMPDETQFLLEYDDRGNVSKVITRRNTIFVGTFADVETVTFTYDDKKNPDKLTLERMGVKGNFSLVYIPIDSKVRLSFNSYFSLHYFSDYNIVKLTREDVGAGTVVYEYSYTYNAQGYPTASEVKRTNRDGSVQKYQHTWEYETYLE